MKSRMLINGAWKVLIQVFILHHFIVFYCFLPLETTNIFSSLDQESNLKYFYMLWSTSSLPIITHYNAFNGKTCGNEVILQCYESEKRRAHVQCYVVIHFACADPEVILTLIARFTGPTWGLSGADRTQVGAMLAPWTLLSGQCQNVFRNAINSNNHARYSCFVVVWWWYILPVSFSVTSLARGKS